MEGEPRSGAREAVQWLAERPPKWGGAWALGCALCAQQLAAGGHSTSWARYEVRHAKQASQVAQHLRTGIHRSAVTLHFQPPAPHAVSHHPADSDKQLLSGAVPQLEDWLRAWRMVRTPVSFEAASQQWNTEHYVSGNRTRPVDRRAIKAMVHIMAETVRSEQRSVIRKCTAISIGVDDKSLRRLIKWQADDPSAPLGARSGILDSFVVDRDPDMAPEDFGEDYSLRMSQSIQDAIRAFCTPLGGQTDNDLVNHFRCSIRCFVADGSAAAQKAGLLIQDKGAAKQGTIGILRITWRVCRIRAFVFLSLSTHHLALGRPII